jgi:putative GTP pyrophosphokinase
MERAKTADFEKLWRDEFQRDSPIFERLRDEAEFTIKHALEATDIKVHSIPTRIKDVDSFIKKANNKAIDKPFEQIHDIVGLRIVCLFLSDINRIGDLIRNNFEIIHEDNKIDGTDASSFGYLSVHFIVTLKDELKGPRYDGIQKKSFEIQVRTISMDAWANISHHIDYKSAVDVPKELKRDFYALSGLLYVADAHFEMLYNERMKVVEKLSTSIEPSQEINLDSLAAYLPKLFPDRVHAEPKYLSELLIDLSEEGYKYISDIDNLVTNYPPDKYIPQTEREIGVKMADVAVIHSLLFAKKIDEINEVIRNWGPLPTEHAYLKDKRPFVRDSYLIKSGDSIKISTSNVGELEISFEELGNRIGIGLPYLKRLMEQLEPFRTSLSKGT